MTIEEILYEAERRRKMFHWFVDGVIGGIGHLTPDLVSTLFNVEL